MSCVQESVGLKPANRVVCDSCFKAFRFDLALAAGTIREVPREKWRKKGSTMTQPQPHLGDIVLYGHVARHTAYSGPAISVAEPMICVAAIITQASS